MEAEIAQDPHSTSSPSTTPFVQNWTLIEAIKSGLGLFLKRDSKQTRVRRNSNTGSSVTFTKGRSVGRPRKKRNYEEEEEEANSDDDDEEEEVDSDADDADDEDDNGSAESD